MRHFLTWVVLPVCLFVFLLSQPLWARQSEAQLWQIASAHMAAEAYTDALPILETLVSAKPRNKHYRFNLAIALYQMERDGRARFHLDQVRGAALTARELQLVNAVIGQINARKVWSGYFGFNLKPESNGTKQTSNRVLTVGNAPLTLDETAIGKPTTSAIVSTGFKYSPTVREGLKLELSLDALLKHNNEVELRDYQLTGRAGLGFSPDPTQYWAGGLLAGKRWVADAQYSETLGLYGNHARRVGKVGTLRFGAQISRDFRRQGRADIDRSFLSVGYDHAIGGNAQISFNAFGELSDSDQRTVAGFRRGASVSALYAFEGGLITNLTLSAQTDDRDGKSVLFGVQRSDRKLAADLRIYHRDFRIGSFAPELQIGIERNKSNIPLADYTNRYLSLGLTRKF